MNTRFLYFFILLVLFYSSSFSSADYHSEKSGQPSLFEALNRFKNDKDLQNSTWSFYAYNLNRNTVIADFNSNAVLVPASLMKVVTTAAAYQLLGELYQFNTYLMHNGVISTDGVLKGDLIIKGTGDPTIGSGNFEKYYSINSIFEFILNALFEIGIKEIEGNIIADASEWGFIFQPRGYLWEDIGNHYGAGVSALNYKENRIRLSFKSGKNIGDKAELINAENHPFPIQWINNVTTAGRNTGDNVYVFGAPFQSLRIINGTIPADRDSFHVFVSDPDPALRFAHDLKEFLVSKNFKVGGSVKSNYFKNNLQHSIIATHKSPIIHVINQYINQYSDNVSAESVFRAIGIDQNNNPDYNTTAESIISFWDKKGVNTNGIVIRDGSGLSRTNLLNTRFLVEILNNMYLHDSFILFYSSLATAGRTGTLKNSFIKSSAENNFIGKTGTMRGVRSYAGYIKNKSGEMISFAFIVNGHNLRISEIRNKMEKLIISISESE